MPKSASSAKIPELKTVAKGVGVKVRTKGRTKMKLGEVNSMVGEETTAMARILNGGLMMRRIYVGGMETKVILKLGCMKKNLKSGTLIGGRRGRRSS